MPTVRDLATELRCTVSDVQRAARAVGVAAKSPGYPLKTDDCQRIREYMQTQARAEAAAQAAAASETKRREEAHSSSPILEERRVGVRGEVGPVAGTTAARLLLHEDFVYWLASDQTDGRLKKRANLVLRQLAAFGRTSIVKSVRGVAKGWRRSPLGGNQGRQFYLWWAPTGAPPVAELPLAKDTVLIRAVRHHDETAVALAPGNPSSDYMDLRPADLVNRPDEYGYAFNDAQASIAKSTSAVRFIKGHPGAGKTTALWLAASLTEGHRALYLTCNAKLALDAEQYFRALGPETLAAEVMTFDQLTAHLLQTGDSKPLPSLDVDEAAEEFEEVIAGNYRGILGPWDGRIDELYAELHAHAVGECVPIGIRDVPASEGLVVPKAVYSNLRSDVLGGQGARTAAQIAAQLAESGLVEQLFPGPARARRALNRLLADSLAVKRFDQVDLVFVDEAQDLTLVELFLLVRLCAAIGSLRQGAPPAFVAAGDEGQTVRPSDFEWGHLADLTASQIGRRSEFELTGNVRSPQNIALVVNRSWDMYRHFAKEERPRGYASAEIEEASAGRVIYTTCRTPEDLREIIEVFDGIPNAALVYPGYRVPDTYRSVAAATPDLVLTSRSAKGLDFQTVGVLDTGHQMVRLKELAEDAGPDSRLSALWGRILADHLRVALSRATENLVLIDVEPGDGARTEIKALCADAQLTEMEPEELVTFLRRQDESDAAELALEFCEEAEKLLGNQSVRAYRRSRQAVALLGDARSPNSVQDAALRRQAWTLRGVAAADLLRHRAGRQKIPYSTDELLTDAVASLRRAERGPDAQAIQLIDHFVTGSGGPHGLIGEVKEILPLLPSLERHIERYAREAIVAWCRDLAAAPVPPGTPAQAPIVDVVRGLVTDLDARHPELVEHQQRLLAAVAAAARAEGRYREALDILVTLAARDHTSEAVCHEQLRNFTSAAQSFELASDFPGALRNLRRVPDVAGALRLAELLNHEDLPALQWLSRYCDVMGSLEPHVAAKLTDAERRLVAGARDDALLDVQPKVTKSD